MASTLAHVTPEVLRWARESVGYGLDDAAERIKLKPEKLERAEQGEQKLTLRQAEKAAEVERPLAVLFIPEPPTEEPQEAQFRRLARLPSGPVLLRQARSGLPSRGFRCRRHHLAHIVAASR